MNYLFLLGGHDLEMLTLRDLLQAHGVQFGDHDLAWGARASAYRADIDTALARGAQPVAVELENDLPVDLAQHILWIDHHGDQAGADHPCSLRQAFDLLGLPESEWTRHFQLVAANDIGHIAVMRAVGASDDEMRAIRLAEFAARGICARHLEETCQALNQAEKPLLDLTVVRLPHDYTGTVTDMADPLFGGKGVTDILAIGPNEWGFYGSGARVQALAEHLGGWLGGALPGTGYWGQHTSEDLAHRWTTLLKTWI